MKGTLNLKFLLVYLLLGLTGFFLTAFCGSALIEQKLTEQTGESLYREAVRISSDQAEQYYYGQSTLEDLYDNFCSLAEYQEAEIWLLDTDGTVIIDTSTDLDSDDPVQIKDFDPVALGTGYYTVGTFYDSFSSNTLSVLVPITRNMSTKGYLALHMSLRTLQDNRDELLQTFYILYVIFFALSLIILLVFNRIVYRPLKQIIQGANAYADGNLSYDIPVYADDEMGYLAGTLNYMSDELERVEDYQKKFISNVSHDFRSPLTSIKGYIEAIQDGTIPPEMQGHYLDIVLAEADRLNKLTQSLLTLNNFDIDGYLLNLTDFDINSVIRDTAEAFGGTCIKRRITIELLMTSEPLIVNADEERIKQVLYNLIDNAIKFSQDGSSIIIETTELHGKAFVSVKDFGSGIQKENLSKIWDRFFKQDSSRGKDRKGTGLGLSIVKEIINAHDQNINVISTEGAGSEFIFTLRTVQRGLPL